MLFDCLASVESNDGSVEVIVFDNGSSDGMVEKASALHPDLRVLRSETNLGFATASNRAAAEARAPYLLFLNSDAILPPNGVGRLLSVVRAQPSAAICQPVIVSTDGSVENAGTSFTWFGFLLRKEKVRQDEPPYQSFAATAACLLMRRDVFEDLGGFNDDYFAYIEDVDLSWRARLAGWDVIVVPSVRVQHEMNRTTKRILAPHQVRYLNFRNRLRTLVANGAPSTLLRVLPLHLLACFGSAIALTLSGRFSSAYAVFRATLWPLGHPSAVIAQRRAANRLRIRLDREVLTPGLVGSLSTRDALSLLREHKRNWDGPPR